jgi:hypothetical protein
MKKTGMILMMLVTISASAQKVTRDDLNKLLLKSDPTEILRDGFTYVDKQDGFKRYVREVYPGDTTYKDVILHHRNVVYFIADTSEHEYSRGIITTAKEDLLWDGYNRKIKRVSEYNKSGEMTDQYDVYKMRKTSLEFRSKKIKGENAFEFKLTRK